MSEPTAACRNCGAPREVPVDGEKVCAVCGSPDVALSVSDAGFFHEMLGLKKYDDPPPVACGDCGTPLDESPSLAPDERAPCPRCGSLGRAFSVKLEGGIQLHGGLALKARNSGKGKPYLESKHGDSYSVIREKWMHLSRVVDRRNNRYTETITDPETGEVVRHVDEPLTDHVGRGDARRSAR